ncbi:MAG: methylenetetrahydrofolate reductase [Bdellovibrionaceae bacterium]|nr:methylenetetrahydrofolate reductase [Pseudobdellovibrionaceae bacterium]
MLGYAIDRKITDVLKDKPFTLSAEIIPPRNGEEQIEVFNKLKQIIDAQVDFLSVTKGAGGSLRGGSLPIAQAIKDNFKRPSIAHFTCRDLVPEEVENQLMDHHYFGIRNILALRGDPPMGTQDWKPRDGGYSYAYQLVQQIVNLNSGQFLVRSNFKVEAREKTDFCIGVAVYPEHPQEEECIRFALEKFNSGADYGITQMLFDADLYGKFIDDLAKLGIRKPILPGVRILKSKKQAAVMKERFGCSVPAWYANALPAELDKNLDDAELIGPFLELIELFKKAGAPGVHLFVLSDTRLNVEVANILNKERK